MAGLTTSRKTRLARYHRSIDTPTLPLRAAPAITCSLGDVQAGALDAVLDGGFHLPPTSSHSATLRARCWHSTKCGRILLAAGSCSGLVAKEMISSAVRKLTTAWLVQAQYFTITWCASGLAGSRFAAFHS